MKMKHGIILLLIYIATTAFAFGGFSLAFAKGVASPGSVSRGGLSQLISPVIPKSLGSLGVDQSQPKTEICPLNGEKFTVSEKQAWEKRRPLAIMIENHLESRPQSGLGSADVTYEMVAEGGITRFMGIFYCEAQAKDAIVAPVRSARQTFIEAGSEYNYPLYAHVGGANGIDSDPRVRALEHLTDYGWTGSNDLNQFSIGYPVFVRNYNRLGEKEIATEHTMESSTYRLWDYAAARRGLTNLNKLGVDWQKGFVPWQFQDDATEVDRGAIVSVGHDFWSGVKGFDVRWDYDKSTNQYKRTMAGEAHIDLNDQKQLTTKNIIVLYVKEYPSVDIHKHVYYQAIGTGTGVLFQNGKQQPITWNKKDRISRTLFTDKSGRQIKLVRGKVWISIVATDNTSVVAQ